MFVRPDGYLSGAAPALLSNIRLFSKTSMSVKKLGAIVHDEIYQPSLIFSGNLSQRSPVLLALDLLEKKHASDKHSQLILRQ